MMRKQNRKTEVADVDGTTNVIDITVKALFRRQPRAALRLAGVESKIEPIHLEDTSISLPEMRADQVFLIGEKGEPGYGAIYLEYQLQPKVKALRDWFTKCGGLVKQLDMPVVLLVIYLVKGKRVTFPDRLTMVVSGLHQHFQFNTIRLWEFADRIRNGEFPELAPLLVLFDTFPDESTLKREIEIIHHAGLPKDVEADLLGMALRLGQISFTREVLSIIFREELDMVRHGGIVEDWIAEEASRAEARGVKQGVKQGVAEGAQQATIKALSLRLGKLPDELIHQINKAEPDWCYQLMESAFKVESLSELKIEG